MEREPELLGVILGLLIRFGRWARGRVVALLAYEGRCPTCGLTCMVCEPPFPAWRRGGGALTSSP